MVMPLDIPWRYAWWADNIGGATRPAEGGNAPSPMPNLGSAAPTTWTRGNTPTWTRNMGSTGKDAAVFGTGNYYTVGGTTGYAERTWVVIGRAKGTSDGDLVDTGSGRTLIDASGGSFRLFAGSVLSAGTANTTPHLFIGYANSTSNTATIEIDGTLMASGGASNVGGTSLYLGDSGLGSGNVQGSEVAFAGYIDRALTTTEKADLLAWANANYVPLPPFGAPTISTTSPTLTTITLNWNRVQEAAGYRVFVNGVEQTSLGLVTSNSATVTGLTQGTVYSLQVLAEKADTTRSALSTAVNERACLVVSSTSAVTTTTDAPSGSGIGGLAYQVAPYLAYRWNARRASAQFYWWIAGATPRSPLYCYLGKWADGLTIEKVSGDTVRIIEWERGAESWRETDLTTAGAQHTINLANTTLNAGSSTIEGPLDGVLLEHAVATTGWVVRLWNYHPSPLPVDKLTLTPASGQLTANWEGHHPDYEVRIDGGSWVAKGSATTHTFSGLTNDQKHTIEVRYATPIGPGPAIQAVGAASAGFSPRSIAWDSLLWASEASLPAIANGAVLPARPVDSQDLWLGDPGGQWAPRISPKWVADVANGRPAFRFDAVSSRLLRTPQTGVGGSVTVVTVGRIVTDPGDIHDSRDASANRVLLDSTAGKWRVAAGGTPVSSSASADNRLHLFIVRYDNAGNETVKVDGVTVITGDAGSNTFNGVAFGASSGASPYGVSEIAFGATISRALTGTEEANLLSWFETEYADIPSGAAQLTHSWTITAVGTTPTLEVPDGAAALSYAFSVAAVGTTPVLPIPQGSAALSYALAITAVGTTPSLDVPEGSAALSYAFSVAAVGTRPVLDVPTGSAAISYGLTIAAVGTTPGPEPIPQGSAHLTHRWVIRATGTTPGKVVVDPIAAVLEDLSICLCAQIEADNLPPTCFCGVMPGSEVPLDYAGDCDHACGMAWVRMGASYPSVSIGAPAETPGNCSAGIGLEIEVGIIRCIDVGSGTTPPDREVLAAAAALQTADMMAIWRAVSCCQNSKDFMILQYQPYGPEGGMVGGVVALNLLVT